MSREALRRATRRCSAAALVAVLAPAQSPVLTVPQRAFPQQIPSAPLSWQLAGRPNDLFVLLADVGSGNVNVFGTTFGLSFSPALLPLAAGVTTPVGAAAGFVGIAPASLPAGAPIYLQSGEWNGTQGFASLLASNVASFAAHAGSSALVVSFSVPGQPPFLTGVYDTSVPFRLQALPPSTRTVRPLPPEAVPIPGAGSLGPLNPSGARFQFALRRSDLGGLGVPEQVVAARWRPLFGGVVNETYSQLQLLCAHSDVVPDYTIDPWTALPAFPDSGLSTQFAANAVPGTETLLYSGPYSVQAQALLPSGYMPFPPLQQPFSWDGQRTLLFETRCSPAAGLGPVQNHLVWHLMVFAAPKPHATVFASAGWNGQPSPLTPASAATGDGTSALYDLELELLRTTSVATSAWLSAPVPAVDYQTPIVASFVPAGTSLAIEYRGRSTPGTETPWSNTPDVADGLPFLQFRVTMRADAATGAVPWLELLVLPTL